MVRDRRADARLAYQGTHSVYNVGFQLRASQVEKNTAIAQRKINSRRLNIPATVFVFNK